MLFGAQCCGTSGLRGMWPGCGAMCVFVHRVTHWCCTRPSGDQIAMGTSMPPVIMVWLKGS